MKPTRDAKKGAKDPYHLRGLEQAICLLEVLRGGKEKSALIRKMHGNEQLVELWMNFLQHDHWIALAAGQWVLTEKGKNWIDQIKNVLPAIEKHQH